MKKPFPIIALLLVTSLLPLARAQLVEVHIAGFLNSSTWSSEPDFVLTPEQKAFIALLHFDQAFSFRLCYDINQVRANSSSTFFSVFTPGFTLVEGSVGSYTSFADFTNTSITFSQFGNIQQIKFDLVKELGPQNTIGVEFRGSVDLTKAGPLSSNLLTLPSHGFNSSDLIGENVEFYARTFLPGQSGPHLLKSFGALGEAVTTLSATSAALVPVPEPSTYGLFGVSAVGLITLLCRRRMA